MNSCVCHGSYQIRWRDREWLYIGDCNSGAIATEDQFNAFSDSEAHANLARNAIMRYHEQIGTADEIEFIGARPCVRMN